jgi:hypothetical protein
VLNLRAGDLSVEDGRTWYRYRGKGGKSGRRAAGESVEYASRFLDHSSR